MDALRKTITFEDRQNTFLNPQGAHTPGKKGGRGGAAAAAAAALISDEDEEAAAAAAAADEAARLPGDGNSGSNGNAAEEDESQLSEAEKIKRKYRKQFQERAEQEAIAAESAVQRKDREAKV